ncbi:CocE/NonD family hydrolase [Clostridiaceae bacterium M8S5]|nr:CocE/NonD family hydrolase [Clostridiaceae bacterium M8S5]
MKKTLSILLVCVLVLNIFIVDCKGIEDKGANIGKSSYLYDTEFSIYKGGLYEGAVRFTEDKVEIARVDARTRVKLYYNKLKPEDNRGGLNYEMLYKNINSYCEGEWKGEEIRLQNGDMYSKHITYTGKVDGKKVTAQLWAQRETGRVMDILTVDGEVIGFIRSGGTQMIIMVKKGYEKITPLVKYDDPILSPIKYGINHLGNYMVEMRDGVKLATEVYLPEGIKSNKKIPTIFIRSCYGKSEEADPFLPYVSRGYALVLQDVRGRDDSEGEFLPYYHEREDASDSIDWIVSQKWSDGNVGMWGASYLGYVVMAAAESGHPNLKAVVSEVNVGSPFIDTVRPGGAVGSFLTLGWSLAQSMGKRMDFEGKEIDANSLINIRPLKEIPKQVIGKESYQWSVWSKHYKYDDFWRHGDLTEHGHKIKAAVLLQSGWHDGDIKGVAESWRALTKHDVPNRRIVLGPWHHGLNSNRDMMDFKYGNNAIDYNFDIRILKWFDRFLKDIKNGEDKKPRATYYLDTENKWMTSDDWNPKETTSTNIYLASDGNANSRLGDGKIVSAPAKTMKDVYKYDPKNAFGSEDMMECAPIVLNELEMRNDTAIYTSKPLAEDLAIAGAMHAEFYASSSAVDTDWNVIIAEIDENGVSRKICDNAIRAEYRNGFNKPKLLTPGKVEKYRIELPYQGHVFKKGHKLRVIITSSNQYMFFPNTNTGKDPFDEPKPIIATQKIYHGTKYPSHIELPVLYGKL